MPQYMSPGVYVEEIPTGPQPIQGVSTSIAGFLGPTERGPEDIQFVSSWVQYQNLYGGHLGVNTSFLSYAVQGFFDNGGQQCFVGRIVSNSSTASSAARAFWSDSSNLLTIYARGRGLWGNQIYFRIRKATRALAPASLGTVAQNWVRITFYYYSPPTATSLPFTAPPLNPEAPASATNPSFLRPTVVEDYDNLSPDPNAANAIATTINAGSNLVRIRYGGNANSPLPTDPVPSTPTPNLPVKLTLSLAGGSDGISSTLQSGDYTGTTAPIEAYDTGGKLFGIGTGWAGLLLVDEVSLFVVPDQVSGESSTLPMSPMTQDLITNTINTPYKFAILSAPNDFNSTVKGGQAHPPFDTSYAAFYYPWIMIYDTYSRDYQAVPPSGHIAGLIANTDIQEGVYKAPANYVVVDATDLQVPVPKADQDLLNPVGINCIRDFRSAGRGIRLWGARTMSSDPEWMYINVRRLFLYIEKSIDEGTQWVVFEPNDQTTWSRVVRSVTDFLTTLWLNGGLFGATAAQAFFVKCDQTTMTADDIDNGRLICYIGVAPVRPAEFVIFRIGQLTADASSS